MIALNYHRVTVEGEPDFYTVAPEVFSETLKDIREQGRRVVTTDDALTAGEGKGLVMLLFDDGTEDHALHVFPMLEAEGVKGVFLVSTAKVGKPGYLSISQVKDLAAAGHVIECHGHSHCRMDRLEPEQLDLELTTSIALIRGWTGRAPRMLAPPGGFFNRRVIETGRRHGLGTIRTMRWSHNTIPLSGFLDCLVVTRKTTNTHVRRWLQGRGYLLLRVAYLAKQALRFVLPWSLYLRIRDLASNAPGHVMRKPTTRNEFLLACLENLRAADVPFCISRNHGEFWKDGKSDIDMMVRPAQFQSAVRCIEKAAFTNGYRMAGRTWFVNFSMVFHAPGSTFVRIDIETDVRWRTRTLLDADTVLAACIENEGLPIPAPEHAALIVLCKCAWMGMIKPAYKLQLEKWAADDEEGARVIAFLDARSRFGKASLIRLLATGDVTDLRKCFKLAAVNQRRIHNFWVLIARTIKRLLNPPGIIIDCPGLADAEQTATADRLDLLFPTAKGARSSDSIMHICSTLFRGGIFWNDANRDRISAKAARLWGGRRHLFHWRNRQIRHIASGQSAEAADASNFIGNMLADLYDRSH